MDANPNTDPNETCHGCGKLNAICSCSTDELADYSQELEKPTSVDKDIVNVSTETTDTTPLPQEAENPPHEATHNLMVKLLTQKVVEALTTKPLTSDQSDLTHTVNAAYEIITAANRADDQVGGSYQTFISTTAKQLSDITRVFVPSGAAHPHELTQERWRQYLLGQTEEGSTKATIQKAIMEINDRISTFHDGDKATKRVAALELPPGTKFSYENLAPRDGDGHANAAKPEVYDRLQVYLNRRPDSTVFILPVLDGFRPSWTLKAKRVSVSPNSASI